MDNMEKKVIVIIWPIEKYLTLQNLKITSTDSRTYSLIFFATGGNSLVIVIAVEFVSIYIIMYKGNIMIEN